MNNIILTPQEIKQARLMMGLTQEEFSKAIGFTGKKQSVNRWERGTHIPSINSIKKIVDLYKSKVDIERFTELDKKLKGL